MSPRAACRLDSLGYNVFDYVAGKADWLAFGLPHQGDAVLADAALTTDVPTCGFRDRLGDVRAALQASPFGMLVALNADGVVLGRLDRESADGGDDQDRVEQLMREGPTTVRPSEELEPLVERMRRARVDAVLVTRSDGRLLGLLERDRGEHATPLAFGAVHARQDERPELVDPVGAAGHDGSRTAELELHQEGTARSGDDRLRRDVCPELLAGGPPAGAVVRVTWRAEGLDVGPPRVQGTRPLLLGDPGPGEITRCVGRSRAAGRRCTSTWRPSIPNACAKLYVNES
jgi:hypothetical protein